LIESLDYEVCFPKRGEDQIECESLGRLHPGKVRTQHSGRVSGFGGFWGRRVAGTRPPSIFLFEHRVWNTLGLENLMIPELRASSSGVTMDRDYISSVEYHVALSKVSVSAALLLGFLAS
jgi:hypothetical protein